MNRKYTNQDVVNDDRLVVLAHKYLYEYKGDWHVVLDFKRVYESGLPLTTTQVRTVLNCMLADVHVSNMPVPTPPSVFDAARAVLGIPHRTVTRQRPTHLELRANWKKPFLVSVSPRACRIHSIDRVKSTITYRPLAPVDKKWQVLVRPVCGSHLSMTNMKMLTEEEARGLIGKTNQYLDLFAFCTTCVFLEDFVPKEGDDE